jgi:NADH-quinone oxidoreductase subunit A
VTLAALADWFPLLVYALLALAIPLSLLAMSFVFATRPKRRARTIPFECGVSRGPPPQQRFAVGFYLTALLFLVFDIEVVFLFPIAVVLREVGPFALGALLFYLAVLATAFVYEWKRGGLDWR